MSGSKKAAARKLHKETVKAAWETYRAAVAGPQQIFDETIAKAQKVFEDTTRVAWATLIEAQKAAGKLYLESINKKTKK